MKIFTIYLSYDIAAQRSVSVWIDDLLPIPNNGGEREALTNLAEKEGTMGYPFHITLFSKLSSRKDQNISLF